MHRNEDGTASVEFAGILRVRGQPVLSPGRLLSLWSGRAHAEYERADAALRPDDAMPVSDKALIAAYAVGVDTAVKVRQLGQPDQKVPSVLELVREKSSAEGQEQASAAAHRVQPAEVDAVLREMIAARQRAIAFQWSNDS
ncbi:hypothetical protein [Streptomyces sp. NPDC001508]|uniref:hypothetical protein n=1 Tax=Streptomyces sp. NPDC001508 TaxID=3154656 RepID=UPI0033238F2F